MRWKPIGYDVVWCERCRFEGKWKSTRGESDHVNYRYSCRRSNGLINELRRLYFHRLGMTMESREWTSQLLRTSPDKSRCWEPDSVHDFFSFFFITKIRIIKDTINNKTSSFFHPTNIRDLPFSGSPLDTFPAITPAEVLKLINKSSNKSSSLDFIPTSLIKSCSVIFSEIIFNRVNLSISQGSFQLKFKLAQVTPLLKKPGLDKNTSSNYRPISNLHNIFKLLERLILSRIQYHTTSSCNFNPFQSAYRRYYSTELALLLALNNIYHAIYEG